MNLDVLFRMVLALMDASAFDELKSHEVTVDDSKHLTKIVLQSAKVRVTIERLPLPVTGNGYGSITNVIEGDTIKFWQSYTNVRMWVPITP